MLSSSYLSHKTIMASFCISLFGLRQILNKALDVRNESLRLARIVTPKCRHSKKYYQIRSFRSIEYPIDIGQTPKC